MHEALEKQMNVREDELFCAKERIKELEENKCALEKYGKESKSINELPQEQIAPKE